MTAQSRPAGPDRDAVAAFIRDTYPHADVVTTDGAVFFSLDAERHWPNFATIVWTDDFDVPLGRPSNISARSGVFRLNLGVSRKTFERIVDPAAERDYAALDRLIPHPVYAKQHWIAILNPAETTFREVIIPLIAEAHDRVAAVHGRHQPAAGGSEANRSRS
jgi:hypothetical protein